MQGNTFFQSCLTKQKKVKEIFAGCTTAQMKYEKIIELGRNLTPYPTEFKTDDRLVKGCQSQMYLHTSFSEGKILFRAYSEALISAGLAALLLAVYNDQPPEAILSCPLISSKNWASMEVFRQADRTVCPASFYG